MRSYNSCIQVTLALRRFMVYLGLTSFERWPADKRSFDRFLDKVNV